MTMTRKEIVNSQDYKAQGIALDWWRRNGYDIRDGVVDIIDAYSDGVIYGWNNPNWISVEDELPTKRKDPLVISDKVFIRTTGGHYLSAVYDYQDKQWIDVYNIETLESNEVTHWMPIVPPRKEE